MATLLDVAKTAGVSTASVSRYINNPSSVREKRAKQIKAAIDKLGYRIDASAQSLKTGRFNRIRIIAPATGPFYWEIMSALAYALFPAGYAIDIALYNKRNVDGTIFFPLRTGDDDEFVTYLAEQGERFVIIDRNLEQASLHQICIDNYDIGASAARLLLGHGHRQFILIKGNDDLDSSHERLQGFCAVLAGQGIRLESTRIIDGKYSPEITYNIARDQARQLPAFTAVFAANDLSALSFIKALLETRQMTVPRDYSIISVDDSDYIPYCLPLLSSFRLPLQTMGALAADMLIAQIDGSLIQEKKVILKAELKLRDSIGSL